MNPILIFLAVVAYVILWLLLSFVFVPLGKFFIGCEKKRLMRLIRNKETAEIQAEQEKIKAQGEAEVRKIAAEVEADARKIEAEANRKIFASLTGELIEKIEYEKCDGKLPQVQGSVTPIIDVTE